ncbi:MAG TPA: ThuA domain-containing protein, partial [Chthoniobacteraceae bacterium]
ANSSPSPSVAAAFSSENPEAMVDFVREIAKHAAANPNQAVTLLQAIAGIKAAPDSTPEHVKTIAALRRTALQQIAHAARSDAAPAWTRELEIAFDKLLKTSEADLLLPIFAAWDNEQQFKAEAAALIAKQLAILTDSKASDEVRGEAAAGLISGRKFDADIMPAINALFLGKASAALQRRILEELGNTGDSAVGDMLIQAYPSLHPGLQEVAFALVLKRADWTRSFVEALKAKTIPITSLSAIALDKLRHYPNGPVAKLASQTIDAIRGPLIAEKDKVIAGLLPVAEKGGDPAKGKQLFLSTCAVCHKFNGEGANLAPDLTGMGAHSRAELLVDIVDPNREVDPSFAAFDFTMKNGDVFQGIISRENAQTVLVRDAAGEHELNKADIASRRELGRSLMPEGFEALGAETLRDILAYIQSVDSKYRIIDLRTAFDADSRHGIFSSADNPDDTLKFKRFGNVREGDVPFVIADPSTTGTGDNLIVLKGGQGLAKTYPQRVTIPVGHVPAVALDFLGGVGGWAYPCCGDEKGEGLPAAKVTVIYEGGDREELLFKNGVEFADFIRPHDVPESKSAADLVNGEQVRVFRKTLAKGGIIDRLVIESFDNRIAPAFVAITAEKDIAAGATPAVVPAPAPADAPKPAAARDLGSVRILAVGGGSSHDFKRWFGDADKATIEELHPAWLDYTENPDLIAPATASLDVLDLSTNQPLSSEARKAIFDFANAGKGLVLLHPAVWYNWPNFPEYNKELVGGGSRGHDRYGEFTVDVVNHDHPVTAGLPEHFKISDELYHFEPDPEGAKIEVLAQATSPLDGKTYPQVWIVKHPKAKIVCITLGHDGAAHNLPEFKRLLQNAIRWAAGK